MSDLSFRWLHLSDIHVGMSGQEWLWPNVRDLLLNDIKKQGDRMAGCDLLVFSGDLVQRGIREEFDRFDEVLDQIWDRLRSAGCNPHLFVIPGNHDLSRPSASQSALIALKSWFGEPAIQESLLREKAANIANFSSRMYFVNMYLGASVPLHRRSTVLVHAKVCFQATARRKFCLKTASLA